VKGNRFARGQNQVAGKQQATSLRLVDPEAQSPSEESLTAEAGFPSPEAQPSSAPLDRAPFDRARSDQSGVRLLYRHTPVPEAAAVDLTVLLDLEELPDVPRPSTPPPVPSSASRTSSPAGAPRVDLEDLLSGARLRMPMSTNRWEDLFASDAWDRPSEPPPEPSSTRESWVGRLSRRFRG